MSQSEFTEDEITDAMRFLDYPVWESLAPSIQLGYPSAAQPLYLVRDSLARIDPTARVRVRDYLRELACIDGQISSSRSRMKVKTAGNVTFNDREADDLRREFRYWQKKLADILGVMRNPYASDGGTGGGISAKVRG